MRGHIRPRSKGTWEITLDSGKDPATGERRRHFETVKGGKKAAQKRLAELLLEIEKGAYVRTPRTLTLAEYLSKWLTDYAWPNLAPKTAEGYAHIIRQHLVPALGNVPLTRLKPDHLQRYYTEKLASGRRDGKGGLSARSVRHHHVTLHDALEHAVKQGLLARNVADAVRPPRCQRPQWRTLSEDDIGTFLQAERETPYYVLFYAALFTGMRRSELLALRWCDSDLLLCQAHVTRTLHHLRTGETIIRAPKSAKGRRMVALSPSVVLLLQEHKQEQASRRAMLGASLNEDSLVFSDLEGKPLLPDTVTHAWIKLVRRVGLKGIRLHDARHTHASLMLKQGVHPKIVQERLGHASIQLTLDTYSHLVPGLQEAAAASFDRLVAPRRESEAVRSL